MIISTIVGNPFSMLFLVFNYIFFCLFVPIISIDVDKFSVNNLVLTILLSLISSILYSLTDQKLLNIVGEKVIETSNYNINAKCKVFKNFNSNYIFQIKDKTCHIYARPMIAKFISYMDNKDEYMSRLKERMLNLNKIDRLVIYLYKYISSILLSFVFIFLLQISRNFNVIRSNFIDIYLTFDNLFIVLIILAMIFCILMILFLYINEICIKIINKIMKKRGLNFFLPQ